MNTLRIALSGSAGTGKTTLGRVLAEHLDVPYIDEGFRERVKAGLQLYKLDEKARRELIQDLWQEQRRRELEATQGFVSDRSSIDYIAFWLHYDLMGELEETAGFIETMRGEASRIERIVLCPWGVLPLEFDGVRSTNPWLQLRFQSLLEGLHGMYTEPEKLLRVPESDDFEQRTAFVLERL